MFGTWFKRAKTIDEIADPIERADAIEKRIEQLALIHIEECKQLYSDLVEIARSNRNSREIQLSQAKAANGLVFDIGKDNAKGAEPVLSRTEISFAGECRR